MNYREKVAHHEAAHAVIALHVGFGISEGIDLDAPSSSVDGAFGNVGAYTADYDPALPPEVQRDDLLRNLQVFCAGAASDARNSGVEPREALSKQPGDEDAAIGMLEASPLIGAKAENDHVLNLALQRVVTLLDRPEVWAKVERVARACLKAGGKLSKAEIELVYAQDHSG